MAYKVFVNGFPLNASELNQYLMAQSIAVFVDATARDAAIETPVQGQFAFLTGSDILTWYDGSAWQTFEQGGSTPIAEQTDNYTIVAGDANSTIVVNAGTQKTITVANVLSAGDRIDFVQKGAGQIQFDAGSGVTLNSADSKYLSAKQYAGATVLCEGSGVYYLIGNLA